MYLGLPALSLIARASGVTAFNPATIWTGGLAGMWLEQSDSATVYQESTGVTAGVLDSPAGLRLDKRLGLVPGSELEAANTGTAQNANGTVTVVGSTLLVTCTVNGLYGANFGVPAGATVGKTYLVEITISTNSASKAVQMDFGNSTLAVTSTTGTTTYRALVSAANATIVYIVGGVAGESFTISVLSIKELQGNHVLQATSAARPTWKQDGAIYSDLLDGFDDGYATAAFAAGTLTADMDCFVAVKRNSLAAATVLCGVSGAYFGYMSTGTGAPSTVGAGAASTYFVNGVGVSGSPTTSAELQAAVGTGSWVIVEVRNLDLSAWTSFGVSNFVGGEKLNGNIGGVILCPAQSDASRTSIRQYLATKVGVTLPSTSGSSILLESGDVILLESGDELLLEA